MLAKGDEIKDKYRGFDFTELDPVQLRYINRLSFFSKYKERITKRFAQAKVSREVKIIYLDHHSMKMGNSIFYNLESKR